jgi:hypothetical protein
MCVFAKRVGDGGSTRSPPLASGVKPKNAQRVEMGWTPRPAAAQRSSQAVPDNAEAGHHPALVQRSANAVTEGREGIR